MRYVLLLYREEAQEDEAADGFVTEEVHTLVAAEGASLGGLVLGHALEPTTTATTVRVREGRTHVEDGPAVASREALVGFYLLECDDLDEAIVHAERLVIPPEGSVEVRPVHEPPEWDQAFRPRAQTA